MTARRTHRSVVVALAGLALAATVATAATTPARRTPATAAPAKRPAGAAPAPRAPVRRAAPRPAVAGAAENDAKNARLLEDNGAYLRATEALRALRAHVAPDADLELALALDEARTGDLDSARVRLESPLLARALVDSLPVARRVDYNWERDRTWTNARFDGWYWYVARARAEVYAALGRWDEARAAAEACVAARPLSGKEWLVLAVCAGRAGDAGRAEAAARAAVSLDPSLPEAHHVAGIYAWRAGRRTEAQAAFRTAVGLDSAFRAPALALVRSRLPGVPADTLPTTLLHGVREIGLLTSPVGPKLEEFVQMDAPATIVRREMLPIADSLAARTRHVQLTLPILVDERGRAVLHELPWYDPADLPAAVVSTIVASLPGWRFTPARLRGEPHRVWSAVSISNATP